MNESRKRTIIAGIVVGTVTVGLAILARKTPRDQWSSTLRRIAGDTIEYVKSRYGDSEPVALVEKALEKFEERERETAVSHAFAEALARSHKNQT